MLRVRVAQLAEIALWIGVMGWLLFLAREIAQTGSLRSVFELALLGLLVWWPMIRHRIKTGYWP